MKKSMMLSLTVIGSLFFLGCQPEKEVKLPTQVVKPTKTQYNPLLRSLNDMIGVFKKKPIEVVIYGEIENKSSEVGKLPNDISLMVDTTLNQIGKNVEVYAVGEIAPEDKANVYLIHGAITKYDLVASSGHGNNAGLHGGGGRGEYDTDFSNSTKNNERHLGLTFNMANFATGKYIPRVLTKNEMTLHKKTNDSDFGFSILGSGFGLSNNNMKADGVHETIEKLVDFSIAELIAKTTNVPYWFLTDTAKPNEDIINNLVDEFYTLKTPEKIKRISYLLNLHNHSTKVTSDISEELTKDIKAYKQAHGFSKIDNTINKELYVSLLRR